jgi:hypothetical protein
MKLGNTQRDPQSFDRLRQSFDRLQQSFDKLRNPFPAHFLRRWRSENVTVFLARCATGGCRSNELIYGSTRLPALRSRSHSEIELTDFFTMDASEVKV